MPNYCQTTQKYNYEIWQSFGNFDNFWQMNSFHRIVKYIIFIIVAGNKEFLLKLDENREFH